MHGCSYVCTAYPTCSDVFDEFCIEIRRESNPRGSKLRSHTVSDLNHSANRVYAIGTECSHQMWWEHSVPIVYTRLAEWLRSDTVWDRSLLPREFDSLRISNAKFYDEFCTETWPKRHLIYESWILKEFFKMSLGLECARLQLNHSMVSRVELMHNRGMCDPKCG